MPGFDREGRPAGPAFSGFKGVISHEGKRVSRRRFFVSKTPPHIADGEAELKGCPPEPFLPFRSTVAVACLSGLNLVPPGD